MVKIVNNIGPQTLFPVPQGILNYHGANYLALSLWALNDTTGAMLADLKLVSTAVIQSGYSQEVEMSSSDRWSEREGGY